MSIASVVTLKVPAIIASTPYRLLTSEVGYHCSLKRNWLRLKCELPRIGKASLKTKKKMPRTKTIALMPHR